MRSIACLYIVSQSASLPVILLAFPASLKSLAEFLVESSADVVFKRLWKCLISSRHSPLSVWSPLPVSCKCLSATASLRSQWNAKNQPNVSRRGGLYMRQMKRGTRPPAYM